MAANNNNAIVSAVLAMGPGPFYLLTLWFVKNNGLPQTVPQLVNNVLFGTMTPPTVRTNLSKLNGLGLVAKSAPVGSWIMTQTARLIWDNNEEKNFFLLNNISNKDSNADFQNDLILNTNPEKNIFPDPKTENLLSWIGVKRPTLDQLAHLQPDFVLSVLLQTIHETIENPRLTFAPGLLIHNLRQINPPMFDYSINPYRLTHDPTCYCDSCRTWRSNPRIDQIDQFVNETTIEILLNPPGQFADLINNNFED